MYSNIRKMTPDEEHTLCALYDLETHVLPHFNHMASTEPAVHYCIEQANHHRSVSADLSQLLPGVPEPGIDDA